MAADKLDNVDLDEDLFDFEPIAPLRAEFEDEEADLDEIFATFQVDEDSLQSGSSPALSAYSSDEEDGAFPSLDDDDDLFGDLVDAPELAPTAIEAPAPAPAPAAAPPPPQPAQAAPPAATSQAPEAAVPAPISQSAPPVQAAPALPAASYSPAVDSETVSSIASMETTEPGAVGAGPAKEKAGLQKLLRAGPNSGPMSRSALWILLAAMSLNGLVAIVLVSSTGQLRDQMSDISDEVEETIRDIRSDYWSQKAMLQDQITPIAAPDPENHPAFSRALDEIEDGRYAAARQRLYALLAVVDRVDPAIREKVEARASYLIGHAWHLEALTRLEADDAGAPPR